MWFGWAPCAIDKTILTVAVGPFVGILVERQVLDDNFVCYSNIVTCVMAIKLHNTLQLQAFLPHLCCTVNTAARVTITPASVPIIASTWQMLPTSCSIQARKQAQSRIPYKSAEDGGFETCQALEAYLAWAF